MGLLKKIFGEEKKTEATKIDVPWILLNDLKQILYIKKKSSIKAQVIFKHSTRCGISSMVKNQFENDFSFNEKELDIYYLDILNYRSISNELSNAFQLIHESPQLLVIKNGELVAHASHGQISSIDLNRYV